MHTRVDFAPVLAEVEQVEAKAGVAPVLAAIQQHKTLVGSAPVIISLVFSGRAEAELPLHPTSPLAVSLSLFYLYTRRKALQLGERLSGWNAPDAMFTRSGAQCIQKAPNDREFLEQVPNAIEFCSQNKNNCICVRA